MVLSDPHLLSAVDIYTGEPSVSAEKQTELLERFNGKVLGGLAGHMLGKSEADKARKVLVQKAKDFESQLKSVVRTDFDNATEKGKRLLVLQPLCGEIEA